MKNIKNWIISLGILIAIVSFLGFPSSLEKTLLAIFGLLIAILAFLLGRKIKNISNKKRTESALEDIETEENQI
jgi:hypothetical protein